MQYEWLVKIENDKATLHWGEIPVAVFEEGIVTDEMEGVLLRLNAGTIFDGCCRIILA